MKYTSYTEFNLHLINILLAHIILRKNKKDTVFVKQHAGILT